MTGIRIEDILVKHWVRLAALNVNKYFEDKQVVKKDLRMYYVKVQDCIHTYTLQTQTYDLYNEYINSWKQEEHSIVNFKNLQSTFSLDKLNKIDIFHDGTHYVVNDGVHRLAILYTLYGPKFEIPIVNLNIVYNDKTINDIGLALKSTTELIHYNGWNNKRKEHGYHSFSIFNIKFTGQRNPVERLNKFRKFYDFTGKYVMDIGSNSGGMLFHLFEASKCLGVDYDEKCIATSEYIKNKLLFYNNYNFVKKDLQKDDISDLFYEKPDVVFLLSMGSWLKNWKDIYELVSKNTKTIFLETNNNTEGKPQIEYFTEKGYSITLVSDNSDDDCTGNHTRQTYMITI